MKAFILCGGRGERLKPITDNVPKPMVPVAGKPILEYQIDLLKKHGVDEAVLLVGWHGEAIENYFGDGSKFGMHIEYSYEDPNNRLGTAGPIKAAKDKIDGTFIVMNGDIISDMNISGIIAFHVGMDSWGTISMINMPSPYGIIDLDGTRITKFREKPVLPYKMNAGLYVLEPEVTEFLPDVGSIETEVFPKLADLGKLHGFDSTGIYWSDVGTHKDLDKVNKDVLSGVFKI
ncbi:nucleotidyltransferase [Methanocella sp. CWC-04]|uniref:Nucleotidyltransferase n=1 Tax=Methanooceanicella nereidis TaxID=2052831 RepID=A0AAP2RF85_9EURY|nr:nucleotidyltransferase family protein [Methanocella sp. CWC-04]MCD1296253.1 nucleotidyltransferase [Methanocella sp. CWC-04]